MSGRPRDDDSKAVMDFMGPSLPIMFREGIEHGFYNYAKSRKLDPIGHTEYTDCTKGNMLYDRIVAVLRELVEAAGKKALHWKIGDNKRATEIMLEPHLAYRIKRIKQNRGDKTTGVSTGRQRKVVKAKSQLVPFGQMVFPIEGFDRKMVYPHPLWITAAFDLDEVEESVSRIFLGVERKHGFIWKLRVPEATPDVIAKLHGSLADKIMELRQLRA